MLLIPIEKLENERDPFRKAQTLEPVGINKRDGL